MWRRLSCDDPSVWCSARARTPWRAPTINVCTMSGWMWELICGLFPRPWHQWPDQAEDDGWSGTRQHCHHHHLKHSTITITTIITNFGKIPLMKYLHRMINFHKSTFLNEGWREILAIACLKVKFF